MTQPTTPQDLVEMLQTMYPPQEVVEDIKKLKYIIYVRKSTDDKDKQVRSLGDQIAECKQLANNLGITNYKILKESESAKEPDIRPKFRWMLDNIQNGKYDGIIAWHPDRLARNMKDAGEIIDLVDKCIIESLKFVSFTFENTPSGKMLLGIAFVLSKQYSDQLSVNVKRGIRRNINEGRYINSSKHGYKKDSNHFLRPDGENFILIKQAFQMRLDGKTLDEIAHFLNKSNYKRTRKMGGKPEPCKMDKKRLSEVFRDPIYTGIVMYGDHIKDFTEEFNFVPMITPDEFLRINKASPLKKTFQLVRNGRKADTVRANLLRGIVYCGDCKIPMHSGISSKTNTKGQKVERYYYRCDTKDCATKNVRAKVVIDFVCDFFEKHTLATKKAYNAYTKEMERLIALRTKECNSQLRALKAEKSQKTKQLANAKRFLLEEEDSVIKRSFSEDVKVLVLRLSKIEEQIADLEEQKKQVRGTMLAYKEFLELFGNLAKSIRKIKEMKKLDFIIRKFFSNFVIKDKKVAQYTLNSPFRELVKCGHVRDCRSDRTRTYDPCVPNAVL